MLTCFGGVGLLAWGFVSGGDFSCVVLTCFGGVGLLARGFVSGGDFSCVLLTCFGRGRAAGAGVCQWRGLFVRRADMLRPGESRQAPSRANPNSPSVVTGVSCPARMPLSTNT